MLKVNSVSIKNYLPLILIVFRNSAVLSNFLGRSTSKENYITLIKKTIKRFLGKDGKLDYNIIVEGGQANPYITNIPSNMQSTVKKWFIYY